MDELLSAFERIIKLLENSEETIWAKLKNYRQTQKISDSGKFHIHFLFLPIGALQEISIDNG